MVFCLKRSSFTEYIEHETQHELASTLSWIAFEGRSWKILHGTGSVVSIKLHVCLCVFLFRVYQKEKSVCSSSFNLDLLPPDRAFIPRWILLCSCSPLDVLVSFAVHLSGNSWCFWREVTWSFFCPQTQKVDKSFFVDYMRDIMPCNNRPLKNWLPNGRLQQLHLSLQKPAKF